MFIYIALALFPVLLSPFFSQLRDNAAQKRVYYFLCGVFLVALIGLRHEGVGEDTYVYLQYMRRAMACSYWGEFYNEQGFEIGSQLYIYGLARIATSPQWLLVASALVTVVALFYFIDRNSPDIPLSITIFVTLGLLTYNLIYLRQCMAMSICLFAYEQAKNKHMLKFLLLIALACSFHQTAIIFLPVYVLCQWKFSYWNVFFVIVSSIVALFCVQPLMETANEVFDRSYETQAEEGSGMVATLIYFLITLATFIYYAYHKNDKTAPLLYILMAGACLFLMRYTGAAIAQRLSFYFVFSQLALLPHVLDVAPRPIKLMSRLILIGLCVCLMVYRITTSGPYYQFFWE